MSDTRFIEESFPVKEVSDISVNEKNIRHGHISTLHIWWARRPLAASRTTAYAALVPAPKDLNEWQRRRDFIIELSRWENSLNQTLLERARRDILQAHAERLSAERGETVTVEDIEAGRAPRPRVLDPFAGGGAIPLEALRLGCEVYASDYNPVAVLLLKATLEYPQKYGRAFPGMPASLLRQASKKTARTAQPEQMALEMPGGAQDVPQNFNPLLEAVKYWGNWVLEEARKELAPFYPPDPDGATPIGYIWARTVPCQNPDCAAEIPLMRQFWLAKKDKKRVALWLDTLSRTPQFYIVGDGYLDWPEDFDPDRGTVARAHVTCPYCGSTIDDKTTRRLFQQGQAGQRMVAVVLQRKGQKGKFYRPATPGDEEVYRQAEQALQAKREKLMLEWGLDPVPDEPVLKTPSNTMGGTNRVLNYGVVTWGDLFNTRQLLALISFTDKVRQAHALMLVDRMELEFANAVAMYLALAVSRCADFESSLVRWFNHVENAGNTFARQALSMTWDYLELNLLSPVSQGTFPNVQKQITTTLSGIVNTLSLPATPSQSSATQLAYPDFHFDAILTDPPYYDNVPYSYLSDFFYVWLKRSVGHIYPDLFSTPLTPKASEIVAYSLEKGGREGGRHFFEDNLKRAFQEMHRILKPEGIASIVYAHKSTEGWETVINALLDSGLVVTGAWPLNTEMAGRMLAQETASLASSIYIVTRKMIRQPTGFYNDVCEEMRQHLNDKLHRLWEEGIGGADFFVAAIGSAIEVFGKYEQVMDFEGNIVRADRLLQDVRTIATDYAVRQILHNGFAGEVSDLTRFYVLWRWNYGDVRVPFDEARKLAQSCGIDLAREWTRNGFVRKDKEFIRVLGPQHRQLDDLDNSHDMIDVLHRVLLLWEKGRREAMVETLAHSPYGRTEAFYRVAQAISETLPNENKEKKLLDGFLAGRERIRDEVNGIERQQRLL